MLSDILGITTIHCGKSLVTYQQKRQRILNTVQLLVAGLMMFNDGYIMVNNG